MFRFFAHAVLLSLIAVTTAGDAVANDRDFVVEKCAKCHGMEHYILPRSRKGWELTVFNMRDFIWDEAEKFSDYDAERIIDYLAMHFGEDSTNDAALHFADAVSPYDSYYTPLPEPEPEPVPEPVSVTTAVATVETPSIDKQPARVARAEMPQALKDRLANPRWKPSAALLLYAEHSGYAAVFFLFALLISGHSRRRLKKAFRPVHVAAALGLFLSLASHGVIYLMRYGSPPVSWYWFGLASFAVVVIVELVGILRKRMGRRFLQLHMAGGYAGLVLAVLHWIWAWL